MLNKQDISKILKLLKGVYPESFRQYTEEMYTGLIQGWLSVLGQYDYEDVENAVKKYMESDSSFIPKPGQIGKIIRLGHTKKPDEKKLEVKVNDFTELEESSKRFFEKTGLDPSLMENDFDYVCQVAYETGTLKQKLEEDKHDI